MTTALPGHAGSGVIVVKLLWLAIINIEDKRAHGAQVPRETISTITDRVLDGLAESQSRPLDPVYAVLGLRTEGTWRTLGTHNVMRVTGTRGAGRAS
ncbi:MAG TPA: hypothetical protein VIK57_03465 [Streptosporangiaceae bacterium]